MENLVFQSRHRVEIFGSHMEVEGPNKDKAMETEFCKFFF